MIDLDKKKLVDNVSRSFCSAKWLQVTIDLQNGLGHSCHHPKRHAIPLDELRNNPAALHNTQFKKEQRRKMLQGKRPRECDYCWRIEDANPDNISDRYAKSLDPYWSVPYLEKITQAPWDQDMSPTYLEVFFSSRCNLSCSYCMANVSTSIQAEMDKFGAYPVQESNHRLGQGKDRGDGSSYNPYTEAFWQWLPEILPDLKTLRVTGGEPLLSDETFRLMDFIIDGPKRDLIFAINSNLILSPRNFEKFASYLERLEKKVSKIEIYASVDAYGEQAEYIRHGLSFEQFDRNIRHISDRFPQIKIVLMCCFNILSIPSFKKFLEYVLKLRDGNRRNLDLDISYLKSPGYLSPVIANDEIKLMVKEAYDFMLANSLENTAYGFFDFEIEKLKRIHLLLSSIKSVDLEKKRDFSNFIQEYDRRKKRSFAQTFPQYKGFMEESRRLNTPFYRYIFNPAMKWGMEMFIKMKSFYYSP